MDVVLADLSPISCITMNRFATFRRLGDCLFAFA